MTREEAVTLLQDTAAKLGEHFDAVQILASRPMADGCVTESFLRGAGNYYARIGLAHEFIDQDKAADQARAIAGELKADGQY